MLTQVKLNRNSVIDRLSIPQLSKASVPATSAMTQIKDSTVWSTATWSQREITPEATGSTEMTPDVSQTQKEELIKAATYHKNLKLNFLTFTVNLIIIWQKFLDWKTLKPAGYGIPTDITPTVWIIHYVWFIDRWLINKYEKDLFK